MLKLITNQNEIRKLQLHLEDELTKRGQLFHARYKTRGLPDGMDHDAYYFKEYDIYWKTGDSTQETKYWNSFGTGKPSLLRDAFQWNIPKDGVNRRVQGGFLESELGVFLLHRGALMGGRNDGSHSINEITRRKVQSFDDAGRMATGIVLPFLDISAEFHCDFFRQISPLVHAVAEHLNRA